MSGPTSGATIGPTSGPSRARDPRAAHLLLALMVLAAAALRLWGVTQGGPLLNGRPDEREMLINTGGFSSGDLNPRWNIYPNLFCWTYWLWAELALSVLRIVSTDWPDYPTLLANDLTQVMVIGRVFSALVGAATIVVLYRVARDVGDWRTGLVAALLLATNHLHVRDSHSVKTESLLALGILVSIACLARWASQRSWRTAVTAAFAIGVTTGFKYNGILLLVAAWFADLMSSARTGIGRLVPSVQLIGIGAVTVATFLACSPYLILDWSRTQETLGFMPMAVFAQRPSPGPPARTVVERVRRELAARAFTYHVTVSLRRGAGLLVALLTPVALVLAFRRPRVPVLVLAAAFSLFYYFVIGVSQIHLARYLTPIVPLLLLLVAWVLVRLADALPHGLRAPALVVLALAVTAEPLSNAVAYDRIASRTDTRVLATQWMTEHLPPDAVVAQLGTIVFALADPELPPGVRSVRPALADRSLDGKGVTHVVTHEHSLPFSKLIPAQMDAIRPHLRLLATFTPYRDAPGGQFEHEDAYYVPFWDFGAIERPGPLVNIYAYE
ncbi:MAG TPA: glycosyltransferase family 39 protein [Candidatus Binatia bacterium]|jgi:4-amino-4-deoxy-L-arabinose transferase-like glycosyltransferase|nr:glycosyltransferase family 39 protein [Candidatus Binatia bacterium]